LLRQILPLTGHTPYVFASPQDLSKPASQVRPMSETAINNGLKTLGIDTQRELTGHGWRAVARTLLAEELHYPPEVIEHQLAHHVPDSLGRAYNRTRYLAQRQQMMQEWADFLDRLAPAVGDSDKAEAEACETDAGTMESIEDWMGSEDMVFEG
jgi:integrase